MRRLLGTEATPSVLEGMRMEEFFKDLFYDFQSSPNSVPTRAAYTGLISTYTRVLRETTNWLCEDSRRGAPVGQLIAAAAEAAPDVTILTFNHDLVIENEIFKRLRLRRRWCLERSYGAIGDTMTLLRSGVPGADFPAHSETCDHSRPISVLKLHGSLNWVVRLQGQQPSARQLTGKASTQDVLLSRRREIIGRLRYTRPVKKSRRGRSSWYTWPVIIPPVYAKQQLIQTIQATWDEARTALEAGDRIVFFGYSLPQADIEAEKLFQRALTANGDLDRTEVINPDPLAASRFSGLVPKKPLSWYPDVDAFLNLSGFDS